MPSFDSPATLAAVVPKPWIVACCAALTSCEAYDYQLGPGTGPGGTGGGAAAGGVPGASGAAGSDGAAGSGAVAGGDGGRGFDLGPPFSEPRLVTELSDPEEHDDDPTLTRDLLEVFFSSQRAGGQGRGDIWRSTRGSVDDGWEPPVVVEELNSEDDETSVAIAPDGLTIWVSTDRDGGLGGTDIWVARRSSRTEAWDDLTLAQEVSSDGDEILRGIDIGTGDLYLAWRDTEELAYDLYVAVHEPGGGYAPRRPIDELNTGNNEADPFVADDARVLYFTANEGDDDDLVVAARPSRNEAFALVRALDELNSEAADRDPWVSDDQRFIMFASRRENDQLDLYVATR